MFIPFDTAHDWSGYDFVVIGAGVAGLFLAEKFAASGKVLVIEAGGTDPTGVGDGYYDLDVTGRKYDSLGQRLSAFGGTSNHWGGHSHPLSPEIFNNRPGFAGWPITYADYAFHLPEAQAWLNMGSFDEQPKGKSSLETGLLAGQQDLIAARFQFSNPILRLGDEAIQKKFGAMANIDIVLDTRVVDINLDAGGSKVETLGIRHLPSGNAASVAVKKLFLCTGGIENPRLMLWAGRKYAPGNPLVGGPNGLTGKYFMEHPTISPVDIYFDSRADLSGLIPEQRGAILGNVVLRPDEGFLQAHGLGRFGMHFQSTPEVANSDLDLQKAKRFFVAQSPGYLRISPFFLFEQTPTETSFVGLSNRLGSDGTPLARLNWVIKAEELPVYRRAVMELCGLLNQHGFAKSRLMAQYAADDWSDVEIGVASHQMGTTRMARDKAAGVVDRNCKVFGLANMYVAGASVFPNCDFVNPTLNLTALAARLANYVIGQQSEVGADYRLGIGRAGDAVLGAGWSKAEADGHWSDGAEASLSAPRNQASKLALYGAAHAGAKVRVDVNGSAKFDGLVQDLLEKPLPIDGGDTVTVNLHFSDLTPPQPGGPGAAARLPGIYLSRMVLQ